VGNNTGRNGLGWDDREEFFGAQSYDFSNELKYGFASSGGMRFFSFSTTDDINLEGKISEIFFSSNDGGFPKNIISGLNYNFDNDKVKLGSRYIYNHRGNERNMFRSSNRFLPNNVTNLDTTESTTISAANLHRAEMSFEGKIDSFNTVRVMLDYNLLASKNDFLSKGQSFRNINTLISTSTIENIKNNDGNLGRGSLVYNKTFRKKGRFIGINGSFSKSNVDELTYNNSIIQFTSTLNKVTQSFLNAAKKNQYQANAMINEPLSNKFFVSLFYNFDQTNQDGDVDVDDLVDNKSVTNLDLTRDYKTKLRYNTVGSSFRYTHQGLNFTLGYGFQFIDLYGNYQGLRNNSGLVDTMYSDPQYYTSLNYQISRNGSIGVDYSRLTSVPQISQLSPVVNNINPLYIQEGNPNLSPQIVNRYSGNLWLSRPLSGLRISMWSNLSHTENTITQKESVTESFVTTTKPINYKSSINMNNNININYPIIKNKVRLGFSGGINFGKGYRLVNNVENRTNTISPSSGINLNLTPHNDVAIYINSRFRVSNTNYSINTSQNQKIITQNHSATASIKIANSLYFNSSYQHSIYRNDRFGQTTNVPILNASIYKQFLSNNKGELRLSVYDLLDKNQNFSLTANSNFVSQSNTLALARYIMLSFSYNIKGLKSGVNDGSQWF
jgi:hypothetical protein